uniref:Uncharacterized protein n=1 Tax=Rhizophora mucronata TaxID=61149 RepID=A0A2P2JE49_RHIMU
MTYQNYPHLLIHAMENGKTSLILCPS